MLPVGSPQVMGILNITPDSFSDGGVLFDGKAPRFDAILNSASRMAAAGVDIFDVGGESTRPGAEQVSDQQELDRVIPVIEALNKRFSEICISVDTSKAIVMKTAVEAGAQMINDVRALQQPGALETAADTELPVVVTHMQGDPTIMQNKPYYRDLVGEIKAFLRRRKKACLKAGIEEDKIIVDPGIGFGKTTQHNLSLINQLESFRELNSPILIGVSRKRMIAEITAKPPQERLAGSLAAALAAINRGASIVRVHDVGATIDAIQIWQAIARESA